MEPQTRTLQCYAERSRDGSWFAMCLDLNLYARGDNLLEVREQLHQIITEYIDLVNGYPEPDRDSLLHRSAPARFWAHFYMLVARDWVSRKVRPKPRSRHEDFQPFHDEACAA